MLRSARACDCKPSYYGVVWDRSAGKHRKTQRFARAIEARNARADLHASLSAGKPVGSSQFRLDGASGKFIEQAEEGIVLNKWGKRYRDTAITDLRSSFAKAPDELKSRWLTEITRGDVQRMIDDLNGEGLGSRIRSVVNALRTLYRWAIARDYAAHNPAADVQLPAMDSKPRDRVATPAEFKELLAALDDEDGVPFALAGYASARAAEIRALEWPDVDLNDRILRLAGGGGKSEAAERIVPVLKPLLIILKAEWLRQGKPKEGKVCRPIRSSNSGELSTGALLKRARKRWKKRKLTPIKLHEARHTCATWLDHAGVSPKVSSVWLGHKTPAHQPGAARLTLSVYTHVLDGEMEVARDLLDAFLASRTKDERDDAREAS